MYLKQDIDGGAFQPVRFFLCMLAQRRMLADGERDMCSTDPILLNTCIDAAPGVQKGLMFTTGQGISDRFVHFTGTLADINEAVGLLTYVPDENFNSHQHAELLTVSIWQIKSSEAKVRFRGHPTSISIIARAFLGPSARCR